MRWLAVATIVALSPFYARYVLVGRRGRARWLLFALGFVPIFFVPAILPLGPFPTLLACLWSLVAAFRLADFARDRYPDPVLSRRGPHFLIPFLAGPDAHWIDPADRPAARRRGLKIIARGLAKLPFGVALMALGTAWPALHEHWFLQTLWAIWLTYFLLTAGFDLLLLAPWYLVGVPVDEAFDAPPLATSPRDFWSRRWNKIFRALSHRHIFLPLEGWRRPVLAVSVVFLFSAAVHEYIVIMALGRTQGHMTAFFVIQGAATVAYGAYARGRAPLPRAAAIGLHLTFFSATAWLFFQPILQILPIDTFRLW